MRKGYEGLRRRFGTVRPFPLTANRRGHERVRRWTGEAYPKNPCAYSRVASFTESFFNYNIGES